VRRVGPIKDSDSLSGNRVKVKVVKNKVAPPFKEAEFDIIFNEGISREGEILDLGVEYGIIDKAGSWLAYNGQKLGQGREAARQHLKNNPDLAKELETKILQAAGIQRKVVEGAADERPKKEKKQKVG